MIIGSNIAILPPKRIGCYLIKNLKKVCMREKDSEVSLEAL
jgi:hypothetical protein